jgi:hypothetical protein
MNRLRDFQVRQIDGQGYVLSEPKRYSTAYEGNFRGTGLVLCGIVRKEETATEAIERIARLKPSKQSVLQVQ